MIKIKNLINEGKMPNPGDDTDVYEYAWDVQKLVLQELPKLNGWKSSMDERSGTIYWNNQKFPDIELMATPFWDGSAILPINIIDENGEEVYNKVIPFKPTYDRFKDIKTYRKMMISILKKAEHFQSFSK